MNIGGNNEYLDGLFKYMNDNIEEQYWIRDWMAQLEYRKKCLNYLIAKKSSSISKIPDCKIRAKRKGNVYQYYVCEDASSNRFEYIKKEKLSKARVYAQRGYDAAIMDKAKKELVELDKYIKYLFIY